jgi:hypothetical protein
MIHIRNCTAVCIDTKYHALAVKAAQRCAEQCVLDNILLLTDRPVDWPHVIIPTLSGIHDYSRFILEDLVRYIDTDYALVFQWDGFALDGNSWDHGFLDFDYIGAPWWYNDQMNVGNGGFSLRSRRLLSILASDPRINKEGAEDEIICRSVNRPILDEYGIRYAPTEVAGRFSFEYVAPRQRTFGFHGFFNFPAIYSDSRIVECIELEPDCLLTAHGHCGRAADLAFSSVRLGRRALARYIASVCEDRGYGDQFFQLMTQLIPDQAQRKELFW